MRVFTLAFYPLSNLLNLEYYVIISIEFKLSIISCTIAFGVDAPAVIPIFIIS